MESIRDYELPAVFAFLEMKVESFKKQKKMRDKADGKKRLKPSDLRRKITRSRSKRRKI